jgi:tetratricopeptide (TPR) repeat protein
MSRRATRAALLRLGIAASLAAVLATPSPAPAHGTLHEQIAELDRRLAADPDNAELLLRRGDLYRRHREWTKSLADLDRAAELAPHRVEVHLLRGRTFLDSDRPQPAVAELERYLELIGEKPEHRNRRASALLLQGKAFRQLGRQLDAAACFRRAVDLAERPGPQAFLDCARAFDAAGDEHLAAALGCLDDGLRRLGPVVSLERAAIELELRRGRFDGALARIDRLAGLSPRREPWLVERGEVLELAGRSREAREAFLAARRAIAELPTGRRRSRAVADLEQRIAAGLARLRVEGGHTARD